MRRGHLRLVPPSASDSETTHEGPLRVLLADNHPRVRQGLAGVLSGVDGIEVAQEALDSSLILSQVRHWHPHVIFLAAQLGTVGGADLFNQLHRETPSTPIVVLTMQRSPAFVKHALDQGARGVVLKDHADTELVPAVHAAAGGGSYISPVIAG